MPEPRLRRIPSPDRTSARRRSSWSPRGRERRAWVDCKEGYEHDTLIEEAFPLLTHGQILSLLYLA